MSVQSRADVQKGLIHAVVEIAAPPAKVFHALTDPRELLQWWGSPDTYRTTEWQIDLRVGGQWMSTGRGRDGNVFVVRGEYLAIDAPRLLELTWRPSWDGHLETRVRYELAPTASGTRLTVTHTGFGDRKAMCEQHGQGWERVLGWLTAHAEAALPGTKT